MHTWREAESEDILWGHILSESVETRKESVYRMKGLAQAQAEPKALVQQLEESLSSEEYPQQSAPASWC